MAEFGVCSRCGGMGALCAGLCHRCYMHDWYHLNRDRLRPVTNAKSAELARLVIEAYGGRCECCGVDNPAFLTIGTGVKGESGWLGRHGGGRHLYSWLRGRGFPRDGYRLLCRNCNMSRKVFGYCPHATVKSVLGAVSQCGRKKRYRAKLKTDIISAYGGCCALCGERRSEFLVIDHINGGGKKHRQELRAAGTDLYVVLRNTGYPKDDYRLLCFNCNDARKSLYRVE